jgi:hypothetical protein
MEADRRRQPTFLVSFFVLLLTAATTHVQEQRAAPSSLITRAEREEFLLRASIVSERRTAGRIYAWRVSLDDGKRKHDAAIETEDETSPFQRNYRFNVAAYELDKALELHLVPPTVVRTVNERPASVTWWVDDVAMDERNRRERKIEPPDADSWDRQMQAVRAFDELVSNRYRNMSPGRDVSTAPADGPPRNYAWGELLITRDWRIWLIDHTATFGTSKQLEHHQSLTRCDRALLRKLRVLNRDGFAQRLATYLSADQLDALESRRALLVKHFDDQIARRGGSRRAVRSPATAVGPAHPPFVSVCCG